MFFRIHDTKTHEVFMKDAFDENALRRNLKKEKKWDHVPKTIKIYPVSQMELEHMFRQWQEANPKVEDITEGATSEPLPPLNGFQVINEAEQEVRVLEGKVEDILSEAAAL